MDIANLNSILESLEELITNAKDSVVKEENKVMLFSAISQLKANPTLEELKDFLTVVSEYMDVSLEDIGTMPTEQVIPATQAPQITPSVDVNAIENDDKTKLDELLRRLKELNNSSSTM